MTLKERYAGIISWFLENSAGAKSELIFDGPYQLIVAVVLSAQCTDKRVNMVTPAVFAKYPTPKSLSEAAEDELYELVKSVSYPRSKARHLIGLGRGIEENFGGEVPGDIEQLQTLPGVGRKTANVVASIIFKEPVIAVDTHVFCVSHRLGLSKGKTPLAVEADLERNIPAQYRADAHHWLILHGRYVCTARSPKCDECGLKPWCKLALTRVTRVGAKHLPLPQQQGQRKTGAEKIADGAAEPDSSERSAAEMEND